MIRTFVLTALLVGFLWVQPALGKSAPESLKPVWLLSRGDASQQASADAVVGQAPAIRWEFKTGGAVKSSAAR